ncbi:MAG: cadherin-like domain-containing protein [Ascidiaceihabitans sp.]|uniref:cadherin-like domain-containing protein n=1 Tax=Ascidiaceihabitans sp. TaxID=1872644 RepID=UPI003296B328
MADNFNDPFAGNLVGLWDFLNGSELDDTGVADGVTQDGWLHGNANIAGDQLHLDGNGDRFEVDGEIVGSSAGDSPNAGDDDPFQLDEGTLSIQFNQTAHVGSSDDVVVSRGETADIATEGAFEIRVSEDGRVGVMHCVPGDDLIQWTDANFLDQGDDVKVTYTWDINSGGTFRVENLTTGETHSVDNNVTGLTMDIGDQDDESWTVGARESDDGVHSQYFNGTVDYLAIYDVDIINNPPALPADGIVDGTNNADLIDVNYNGDPEGDHIDNNDEILAGEGPQDDIVDALGGDDTINSGEGNDEVFAGSGSDYAEGGTGDDVLYGDGGAGGPDNGPDGDDTLLGGEGQDTIFGEGGNDVLLGGSGDDSIDGGADDDLIYGDNGDNGSNGGGNPNSVQVTEGDSSFSVDFDTDDCVHTEDVWFATEAGEPTTLKVNKSIESYNSTGFNGYDTESDDEAGEGDNLYAFRGTVVKFTVKVSNTSDVTATGVVLEDSIPENIDIWQPGQDTVTSETGDAWNNTFWGNNFNPALLEVGDTSNGTVQITEPGLAPSGQILGAGSSYGLPEGQVRWELGEPLEPGESVELVYYGIRGAGAYDYANGTEFDTQTVIVEVDQELSNESVTADSEAVRWISPIAFDLNDNGEIDTTGDSTEIGHDYNGGDTVNFDLDDDGTLDEIEWLDGSGDGLLIDLDVVAAEGGNVDGSALFGDEGGEWANGYEKLSDLKDTNNDGVVSGSELDGLAVWVDDGDGVLETGELKTLDELGINEISTAHTVDSEGRMVSETKLDAEALGTVTYSLEGPDAGFFQIDEDTGEVTYANGFVPNFDNPSDQDGDNIYELVVVRDGDNLSEPQREDLRVQVNDEDDTNDDVIAGGTGNDTIFGNEGDDTIDGGAGDDLIYGDNGEDTSGLPAAREIFQWDDAPGFGNNNTASDFTQDTGNANVTFSILNASNGVINKYDTETQYTSDLDSGVNENGSFNSVLNGDVNSATYGWSSDTPVENVEFRINDIDGDGRVVVRAYDEDGNPIEVVLSDAGSDLALSNSDGVPGNDTASSIDDDYADDDDPAHSVLVTIPGPVARWEVLHEQDGTLNTGINFTDIAYDVPGTADTNGEAGDDVITGGAGSDVVFGEGGDDTFIVTSGADGDGDVIDGGNGPDETTDNDVLDLRGAGVVTIDQQADANDDGATTGTVTFADGSTLDFEGIETILSDPQNEGPTANDDDITVDEDDSVTFDPTANDTDPNGDPISVDSFTQPDNGTVTENPDGTLTYTPDPDYNGPDSFTVTVTDPSGETSTSTVNVSVTPVNDGPDAVNDSDVTDEDTSVTVDLLANDTDVEGDDLEVTGATVPADQGTLVDNGDGTVTFTPAPNFNGTATISYAITDGNGGTDTAIHEIEVAAINDDPVAVDDLATTNEDEPVTIDLIGNDTDVDGDPLTIGEVSVPADQGTVEDNGDGTVTFTPAPNFNGPATITYTVVDGQGGEDEGTAVVSVGAVNDGPVAVDDAASTDEDTPVTIDLVGNDTDEDGDDLTLISVSVPADQGTVEDNGDGTVTFTPAPDFNGEATITYEISDSNGGTDTGEAVVDVIPMNDGPDAVNDDAGEVVVGETLVFDPLVNDTDPEGDPLTITDATVPADQGTVGIVGNQIEFTPAPDFEGEATITYTIEDPDGGSDTAEITVFVRDGIVTGTDAGELIDEDYTGDPGNDLVDSGDNVFSDDPEDEDDDIIVAGGGNDTVIAGDGDDTIAGGTGEDVIAAGDGDDVVDGGADDDDISTGDGSDTVEGGDGDDVILTGNGDLAIDAGYPGLFSGEDGTPEAENDRDFVDGGAGNDTISTGDDRDTIVGGTGDDVIDGGIDDDVITGDEGDDRIVGGEGSDDIQGGIGNDTIYAGNDPDLGLDNLNIEDDGSNPFGPDLRPDNGIDTVSGGEGDDVIFGADDADILMGDEGNDFIDGEIDDDTIDGGIGNDTLLGGQGRDDISGGIGNDSIDGGSGKDLIDGGDGDDTIDGGTGADVIEGGEGNDLIDGGLNADIINGGAGNDTIIGGNGADVIDGGDGDDQIDGGTGDDTLNGGAGNDSITGATGDDVIDGGTGNDTIDAGNGGDDDLSGGDDRDTFINVNAGDVVDGNEGGDDFDTLDLSGSAPSGGSLQVVFEDANPENGVVNYFDSDGNDAGQLTFTNIENVIPCFTPGTLIATPKGERRVEDLAVGDRIITRDNGIQEIRWMGAKDMKAADFAKAQHLRPIMISQGALGGGLPERDMMVSPNHRVLVANDKTALYFEEREVLVAAKFLTGLDGVDVVDVAWTTYIHIMFEQHEVVLSDGAWTESFQPGDQTLAGVGNAQRNEIFELFPELETREGIDGYTSARRALKKHEAALLTK